MLCDIRPCSHSESRPRVRRQHQQRPPAKLCLTSGSLTGDWRFAFYHVSNIQVAVRRKREERLRASNQENTASPLYFGISGSLSSAPQYFTISWETHDSILLLISMHVWADASESWQKANQIRSRSSLMALQTFVGYSDGLWQHLPHLCRSKWKEMQHCFSTSFFI